MVCVVIVEEDEFGCRDDFEDCCYEFFVKFADTSALDAIVMKATMRATPTSPMTLKMLATVPVLEKNLRMKIWLVHVPQKNFEN